MLTFSFIYIFLTSNGSLNPRRKFSKKLENQTTLHILAWCAGIGIGSFHNISNNNVKGTMFILICAFRFIGPFLNIVHTWERRLSLISEVIDEWFATQRKWLYLEGIFVGGDIRTQLPEEAKKFDDIDRVFRKVCHVLSLITIFIVFTKLVLIV